MPRHIVVPGICVFAAGALALAPITQPLPQRAAPAGRSSQQDFRSEGSLWPGDVAPDFTLEPRGGGPAVTLSSFRGRAPVALVFGSYT